MRAEDVAELVLTRVTQFLDAGQSFATPEDERRALKVVIEQAIRDGRVAREYGPMVQIGDRIHVLGARVQVVDIARTTDGAKQIVTKA